MRNRSITHLIIIGTALAVGMSVVALGAIAHSPVEPTQVIGQEAHTNRSTFPISEEFRLGDHQQLKGHFLGDRFR